MRHFAGFRRAFQLILGSERSRRKVRTRGCPGEVIHRKCGIREPDAGNLHVRFDEGDVETGLRPGYLVTFANERGGQTNQTYCYRATSLLYRQRSVTNGCFQEAKLQRRLYGDELGEGKFASRPKAEVAVSR